MIDEKKLIKDIKEYHSKLNPKYISKLVDAEILDIIDIINEQPKVCEWISVSERLPEIFVSVLVNWRRYLSDEYYIDILYLNEKSKFVNYYGEINGEPIAWMHLPEPYRGDKS